MQPQHQFQIVGLVPTLSFIIARLDNGYPLAQWNDPLDLRQKFLFSRLHLSQFIAQGRQRYLLIHTLILPLLFCTVLL